MAQENVGKGVREPRRAKIAGKRGVLSVRGKRDPEFAYRIVNDSAQGARIAQFLDNDWEIVQDENTQIGEKTVDKTSKEGGPLKVSVGQGTQAYLMRKKKEWHEQDQMAKQAEIEKREASQKPDDTYGSIKFDKSEVNK